MIATLKPEFWTAIGTGEVRDTVTRRVWTAAEWADYQAEGHEQVRRVCLPGSGIGEDAAITNCTAGEAVIAGSESSANPFADLPLPTYDHPNARPGPGTIGHEIFNRRRAVITLQRDRRSARHNYRSLTIDDLADRARVSREWISRIEKGRVSPKADSPQLLRVFTALEEFEAEFRAEHD